MTFYNLKEKHRRMVQYMSLMHGYLCLTSLSTRREFGPGFRIPDRRYTYTEIQQSKLYDLNNFELVKPDINPLYNIYRPHFDYSTCIFLGRKNLTCIKLC